MRGHDGVGEHEDTGEASVRVAFTPALFQWERGKYVARNARGQTGAGPAARRAVFRGGGVGGRQESTCLR